MFKYALLVATLASALTVSAQAVPMQTYHVRFAAMVGPKPFRCGTPYSGLGRDDSTVTVQYFRFYVAQVAFIDASGHRVPLALRQDGVWQQRDVAFLSFEDPGTDCANGSPQRHEEVVGSAPAGRYTGIEFTLGVPDDLDHADATIAQSPLNLTDMFWSWRDGYKFLRFDAQVDSAGKHASYVFHLGSTGCMPAGKTERCASPNRATIALDGFDPTKNVVVADLAAMFRDANLAQLADAGGCMAGMNDGGCQPVMRDLGVKYLGQAGAHQQLFSVR